MSNTPLNTFSEFSRKSTLFEAILNKINIYAMLEGHLCLHTEIQILFSYVSHSDFHILISSH